MTLTTADKITKGDRVRLGMTVQTVTRVQAVKTPQGFPRVRLWTGKGARTYSPSTMVERMI